MSRAYRIRVQESLRRVVTAEDHVSTQLELLELLPAEQMADLLAAELERGLDILLAGLTATLTPRAK